MTIKPTIIEHKPCFTDVVRNENKYLRDYLTHEAYTFEDFSNPLKHLRFEFIPHYHPTPEALEKSPRKISGRQSPLPRNRRTSIRLKILAFANKRRPIF